MSTIETDLVQAATGTNTALKLKGKGSGVVKLGDGELSFPDADGSSGQIIKTDGSGALSFTTSPAANSVDSDQYVDGSIDLVHMSANSVDSDQYVDGSIDLVHMSANSVDSDQYVDGSIDSAHLADDAVTLAKMASGTDGNIISFDASGNPVAVATGTSGHILTSAGAGAAPTFAANATIGQHTIWVPAGAMEAAVTTAAATSNAVEIGTSLFAARTMDFATGADDFCYFGIQMPKSWDDGTLVCQFVWSATGTTANTVLWAIAATSLGNDEVLTTAFPTPASPAADTNSTTADDLMISAEVTLTVGSTPTAEDYVIFEVSRDVSGDTLSEDARLHGIKIHYTTDTGSDT